MATGIAAAAVGGIGKGVSRGRETSHHAAISGEVGGGEESLYWANGKEFSTNFTCLETYIVLEVESR